VTPGEDAFRERTVEAQANSEEAVVSKTARVTGEVVVEKDAEQRTETVSDTVRSTKVDVEDERKPANRR
jgi:stress response protein YsnF